jgi:Trk-type K+ transport system membrane component
VIPFAIIAPYDTLSKRWRPVFEAQGSAQIGSVDPSWASLYATTGVFVALSVSLLSCLNSCVHGLWHVVSVSRTKKTSDTHSLVDLGMLPFGQNYVMVFTLMFPILAGNHALPIWLRLCVWIGTKVVKDGGEMDETLHFLLDHPRRYAAELRKQA